METEPQRQPYDVMSRAADAKARAYYWLHVFHASQSTDQDARSKHLAAEAEYAELEPRMFVEACERMSKSPETSEPWGSPESLTRTQRLEVYTSLSSEVTDVLVKRLHAAMVQIP